MNIVFVEWKDAVTHDNWDSVESVERSGLKTCYAAGFLITDSEEKVTIALLSSNVGDAQASWINIPKTNVIKITEVGTVILDTGEVTIAKG